MQFVYWFAGGLVLGFLLGYFLKTKETRRTSIIDEKLEMKNQNLMKIEEFLANNDQITNRDVQELLGVSDATATRYLDDLEKQGIFKKVDKSAYTYYKKQ